MRGGEISIFKKEVKVFSNVPQIDCHDGSDSEESGRWDFARSNDNKEKKLLKWKKIVIIVSYSPKIVPYWGGSILTSFLESSLPKDSKLVYITIANN